MTNHKLQYKNDIFFETFFSNNYFERGFGKEKEYGFCMQYVAWKDNIWYNMMSIQNTYGRKKI